MTIKLCVLKSGEDVIADVQEIVVGDEGNEKVVGYFFTNSCVVKILEKQNSDDKMESSYRLQLTPWMPLTSDSKIPLPSDWVITMVEPITQLKEMYLNGVLNGKTNQNTGTDKQSDPNQSD